MPLEIKGEIRMTCYLKVLNCHSEANIVLMLAHIPSQASQYQHYNADIQCREQHLRLGKRKK